MRRALVVMLVVVGCSGPSDTPDSGSEPVRDAGTSDAGTSDAGTSDAGTSDAGTSDAGTSDAGTSDAGTTDAGTSDAGASDAGSADAGSACATDLECPIARLCTNGLCVLRPVQPDGGFPCLQPCDCRMGERCEGVCVPDPIAPTFFLAPNGLGDGRSPGQASGDVVTLIGNAGPGETFALRAPNPFALPAPIEVRATSTSVVGGYVECAPTRWVRDATAWATLRIDGGTLVRILDAGQVRLDGLDLEPSRTCVGAQVEAMGATDLRATRLRGRFASVADAGCAQGSPSMVLCTGCLDAGFDGLVLGASQGLSEIGTRGTAVVRLIGGSGDVGRTRVELQTQPLAALTLVDIEANAGPVRVSQSVLPIVDAPRVIGVSAINCAAPVAVEDSVFDWSPNQFTGVFADDCSGVSVERNTMVQSTTTPTAATPIRIQGLAGPRISGNTVIGRSASVAINVNAQTSLGPLDVRNNRIQLDVGRGISVSVDSRSSVVVSDNRLTVNGLYGLSLQAWRPPSLATTLWHVAGNDIQNAGASAMDLRYGSFRVERNQLRGRDYGANLVVDGVVELSSNALAGFNAVFLDGYFDLTMLGNTLSATTWGIHCGYNAPTKIVAVGNIVGIENSPNSMFLKDQYGACSTPSTWRSNYFWGVSNSTSESLGAVVLADAGTRDPNNNLYNFNVSCFADAGTYRLAPNSPCVDTGQLLFTNDGGLIEFDLEGQSRLDAGLPDIGAYELH